MTKTEIKEEALKLPPEERAELIDALNTSFLEEPLTDWQKELLDERLAEDERDPESALPGEVLLASLRRPRA
jgi:putative addiction module component (TIGR02574 family)